MSTNISESMQNYEIIVRGKIDHSWLEYFCEGEVKSEKLENENENEMTMVTIQSDQAGLIGLLRKMHAIGITMISIQMD